MKRSGEAEKEYRRSIELDPELAEARIGLGIVLHHASRYAEAVAEFDHALRLDEQNAFAHSYRGGCLLQIGRAAEAEEEFRRAVELDPALTYAKRALQKIGSLRSGHAGRSARRTSGKR
jgi:Flp pilus assembly protein TadD